TLLFSATMAEPIKRLASECLHDPKHISLIQKRATPKNIEHFFVYLSMDKKQKEIVNYFKQEKISQAIIFCNARHIVDKLSRVLRKVFKDVEYIHAGLDQGKRSSIFRQFRAKRIRYLIATDVAGRGLDFSNVSHIVNWDFPRGEQYTHRTGRTGRMGRKGKAITFVTRQDLAAFNELITATKIVPFWIGKNPLDKKINSSRS
ncbi:MAG: DEAD/DEAH box helicase, partial [Candidatus Omnitrophica bacterium]|nr:DEAD/DEAH box helicase [Candidatus Omnitrophota bacterium]